MKRYSFKLLSIITLLLSCVATTGCEHNDPVPGNVEIIDKFSGPYYKFVLGQETEGLNLRDITLLIQAEDGSEFERMATHERKGDRSEFKLSSGIKEGVYRLLAITATETDNNAEEETVEFGLGSRIEVSSDGIEVIDSFNPELGFAGRGTKVDPYIVSSPSHLFNLMMAVNDHDSNKAITPSTYFSQVRNLDMKSMSRSCDLEYGWISIGADVNTPFRGVYLGNGRTVSNLMAKRPNTAGVGLFGFVIDATIDGLTMKNCTLSGQYAVGSVAGAVVTSGNNKRGSATFTNCKVIDSKLECPATSVAVGGIVGAVDMYARSLVSDCSVESTTLSGGMNVGGMIGNAGLHSSVTATNVENKSGRISTLYSGAGGIVGTADTLQIVAAKNMADITGCTSNDTSYPYIGTGGIAGGTGYAWFTACENSGTVTGKEGVGGIVGSARVKGSDTESFLYNQAYLRHCSNSAPVSGSRMVGGLIGEAQAGAEAVYNTASVSGSEYIGGICGNSSVGIIQNAVNTGDVKGTAYIGGILGKTTWGSLANNQNLGKINASGGIAGGILALGGNNTMIHYCSNFGEVDVKGNYSAGGIVAEIGDPREWTATNIVECVVGSMEIIMSFAGPALAIVEETVEIAHGVEIAIKIVEKGIELALQTADYSLFGYGLAEMISPEKEEELEAHMKALTHDTYDKIDAELNQLRSGIIPTLTQFPSTNMSRYVDNITSLTAACADEKVNDRFQDAINEAREERAEKLEKVAKAHEIAHTVISGVAIAASTVALIGGTVATGGAATAFFVLGTAAAFVGGANALIKTCSEFENNAVVISQCVNAAPVSSGSISSVSSIAGRICDGVQVSDCLNTASTSEGQTGIFVGRYGNHTEINHSISAVPCSIISLIPSNFRGCIAVAKTDNDNLILPDGNLTFAAPRYLALPTYYEPLGFDLGDGKLWSLPEDVPFAIPEKSCYL